MDDWESDGNENNYLYGFGAVLLAILSFGTFAVPLRNQKFVEAKVHPIILQCYFSCMVFLTSFISLAITPWDFSWWGWLGAGLWVFTSILSFIAIGQIGIAVPQAVWSGSTIIVSFLWGAIVFNEDVKSFPLSILGIFLLCVGILGTSICSMKFPVSFPKVFSCLYCLPIFIDPERELYTQIESSHYDEFNNDQTKRTPRQWTIGILVAILMGIPNGSMMVPTQIEGVPTGIGYLMSFSTGVIIISFSFGLFLQMFSYFTTKKFIPLRVEAAFFPGMAAGLLWSSGNLFSIYATQFLGLTIGFPLTQVALVIAGLWGLFFFKEMTETSARIMFFVSALIILSGGVLISLFG
jgi:glucose uptake protein GlcU